MKPSDCQAADGAPPAPGLLILTGASHTGKTTVAREILASVSPPAAFLCVDDVLTGTLTRPSHSIWAEIPLVYELLASQLETLLDHGWFVILESTFTYVPDDGPAEFHAEQLERMTSIAECRNAPWLLVQLRTPDGTARVRAARTGRLPPDIVDRTVELHRTALQEGALRLDVTDEAPAAPAQRILAELSELSPPD